MKKLISLIPVLCLVACQQSQKQYFEESPEIDIVKNAVQAVLRQDFESFRSIYADTAKIAYNTWDADKFISLDEHIASEKAIFETFTDVKIADGAVYCMVVNNKGEKWVLMWLKLLAKTKTGTPLTIAIHEGLRFENSKVVFHFAIYDNMPLVTALQPSDTTAKR